MKKDTQDGKVLFTGTDNECFIWLLRSQSASVDHALKYEGYAIEPANETEGYLPPGTRVRIVDGGFFYGDRGKVVEFQPEEPNPIVVQLDGQQVRPHCSRSGLEVLFEG